jgi:nitrite reductase/ring-hydroxylating ferredoxin subunit
MGILDFLFSIKTKKKIRYKVFESLSHAQNIIPLKKAILVEAGKTKICLSRTESGFFAIENICPHEFKPLHTGTCTDNDEIICPFHRHIIDLKTGQNKSHAGCGKTNTYEIENTENGIYVWV